MYSIPLKTVCDKASWSGTSMSPGPQCHNTQNFIWSFGFLLFRSLVIFLVFWFSIYLVLWIWSMVPAGNPSTQFYCLQLFQSQKSFSKIWSAYRTSPVFKWSNHIELVVSIGEFSFNFYCFHCCTNYFIRS